MDISLVNVNNKVISVTHFMLLWLYFQGCLGSESITKRALPNEQQLSEKSASKYYTCILNNCSHNTNIVKFWACVANNCDQKKKSNQKRWIDTGYYRRSLTTDKCLETLCKNSEVCGSICEELQAAINKRSSSSALSTDAKWVDPTVYDKRSFDMQRYMTEPSRRFNAKSNNLWEYHHYFPFTPLSKRNNAMNSANDKYDRRWLDAMTYKKDRPKTQGLVKRSRSENLSDGKYELGNKECKSCEEKSPSIEKKTMNYCFRMCNQNLHYDDTDLYGCIDECSLQL